MNHRPDTRARRVIIGGLALILGIMLAACGGSHSGHSGAAASSAAAAASSAKASIEANPTTAAELAQAKALVKSCFPAAPLDQIHTVHLVFLSSATGKNGSAVVAARTKLFDCLGIPQQSRTAFKNDALTAAEHAKLTTHAGRVTYFEETLPGLVLKYKQTAGPADTGSNDSPTATPTATGSH